MVRMLCTAVICLALVACQALPSRTAPATAPPPLGSDAPAATVRDQVWNRTDLPEVGETTSITALLADDGGFVLAGGINEVPAVWSSADAVAWTVDALPGVRGLSPSIGATATSGMVLIGGGGTERCAHPASEMAWARPAGGTWTAAPFDDLFCTDPYVEQLTTDGTQWLLAGTGFGEVGFAWTSVDGLDWKDATPAAMRGAGPRAAGWDGSEFVVLAVADPAMDAWTSADGRTWTRAGSVIPVAAGSASIASVAGRMIALVQDGQDQTTSWERAADGTWSALAIPGLDPAITLRRLLVLGDQLVFLASQEDDQLIATWHPGDPTVSIVAGPPDAVDLIGLVTSHGTVVVLGGVGSIDERHPAAWSAPASLLP